MQTSLETSFWHIFIEIGSERDESPQSIILLCPNFKQLNTAEDNIRKIMMLILEHL